VTLAYRVYKGDAAGGPVDYATVVATVSTTTYVGAALAPSSRTRFGVRAYDTVTGLDDGNRDVAATVALDASGNDVSGTPGPILNLKARAGAAGTISLSWVHHPAGRPIPAGFKAWATAGPTVDYAAAPALTQSFAPIAYDAADGRFSGTISGLTPGTAYAVGVRAYNAAGADSGTVSATVTPVAAGPAAVLGLSLTATLPSGSPTGRAIPGSAP
jgi:hypothetical protein